MFFILSDFGRSGHADIILPPRHNITPDQTQRQAKDGGGDVVMGTHGLLPPRIGSFPRGPAMTQGKPVHGCVGGATGNDPRRKAIRSTVISSITYFLSSESARSTLPQFHPFQPSRPESPEQSLRLRYVRDPPTCRRANLAHQTARYIDPLYRRNHRHKSACMAILPQNANRGFHGRTEYNLSCTSSLAPLRFSSLPGTRPTYIHRHMPGRSRLRRFVLLSSLVRSFLPLSTSLAL